MSVTSVLSQLEVNSDFEYLRSPGVMTCYSAMVYLVTMLIMDNFVVVGGSPIGGDVAYKAGDPSVIGLYYIIVLLMTMIILLVTTMVIIVKCPTLLSGLGGTVAVARVPIPDVADAVEVFDEVDSDGSSVHEWEEIGGDIDLPIDVGAAPEIIPALVEAPEPLPECLPVPFAMPAVIFPRGAINTLLTPPLLPLTWLRCH